MHKYHICHRITTLAQLSQAFKYKDYEFTSYDPEPWKSDAWVASRTVNAQNAAYALNTFITELIPLLSQFSTISQCSFRLFANTYLIYRLTNNDEKRVWVYFVRKTGPVGLPFDEEEKEQLTKFWDEPRKEGLFFVMEAANATTYYTRLAMLIMAVEGLAGEKLAKNGRYFTDPNVMVEILGPELKDLLYKPNEGLRNKLFHGIIRDHALYAGLADEIYGHLVDHLNNKFGFQIAKGVIHPQRNPSDGYEAAKVFYGYKDKPLFDLKVIDEIMNTRLKSRVKESDVFVYLGNPSEPY